MWITLVPAQHILTLGNVAPSLLEHFVTEKDKGLLQKRFQAVYSAIISKVNTMKDSTLVNIYE